ncbi:ImmA/IrrE family metallo-endopeptidase [Cellulomonas cellasea]|uniref:IrrE N-terminal-like domain-containing protein n=2 Tax=Cellulomonas cellasea TaxID=43670 RepID=A0A0A0BC74_9CELL|nr:ImmA/IrrE family metallo-endopeptidase [Cellulomonas cellasea]KGM03712.1 hypothetical protein Q760_14780 [Cellulomonas cellasea DSM 20118]GEA86917.1 hypothetical protein CCE01nite_08660 [Cellulomonas cellasea]
MASTLTGLSVDQIRKQASDIAVAVLENYWDEAAFPVDPVQIARRIGVEVFSAELGNEVSGLLLGNEEGAAIYIDQDQPPNRYRFTVAHELGHYVERGSRLDAEIAYIDRRSDDNRGDPDEIYANQFAGELLMPKAVLEELASQNFNDVQIASYMGVSLSALQYRKQLLSL